MSQNPQHSEITNEEIVVTARPIAPIQINFPRPILDLTTLVFRQGDRSGPSLYKWPHLRAPSQEHQTPPTWFHGGHSRPQTSGGLIIFIIGHQTLLSGPQLFSQIPVSCCQQDVSFQGCLPFREEYPQPSFQGLS